MRPIFLFVVTFLLSSSLLFSQSASQKEADEFLKMYYSLYQPLYTVVNEAYWAAGTDVGELNTGQRVGADKAFSTFQGSTFVLERTKQLLQNEKDLNPITVRELKKIRYNGAHSPGTIPEVVSERVAAEARQSAALDGFEFCLEKKGDRCVKPVTPNQIEEVLGKSTDIAERQKFWETSKQSGVALKPGLIQLQKLRNQVANEGGFPSYFALEVSDYGMTVPEMMQLNQKLVQDLMPLYQQLHTWAKHRLAEKYKQPVPDLIPAHWLGNRWGQAWPAIVEGVDLDPLFKGRKPEWLVRQAESFYTSMGLPKMPETFWKKSDLYELPPDAKRKKNTHASAWHIDLQEDVRSLMSVRPNFYWFTTTHHELGHIYYYMAYSNPDVPLALREGANRAFHEGIGYLIAGAASQVPYLREIGVLPPDMKIDQTQWLLNEALDSAVVFMPWSAGTMTHWEHDFYEKKLSPDEFNKKWWQYVAQFQGIAPPTPRGEEFCDAATKTHINDDPAQYYDYALSYVIQYQLHEHIAKKILKQDPHSCNYYGNKEVGKFLWELLKLGQTRDWREVIKEKTGEELSSRAMMEYFAPLMEYLKKENEGRKIGW